MINQGSKEPSVHFKEIQVQQLDKHGQAYGQTIQGC